MTNPIQQLLKEEELRQRNGLELIPSENFVSDDVLQALGSVATNKYAEGYPGRRYYGGCSVVDQIEQLAIDRAKALFGAEHVNVQPLSGAPANLAIYSALLEPGDTVLGMDLSHGGHLTHGHPVTFSAKMWNFIRYKTTQTGEIDYNELEQLATEHHPKLILVGYSSYSRDIDYARIQQIADRIGALTMADISHYAAMVTTGLLNNPIPLFDVVMTTTHKTLRGPRGAMILCKEKHAATIDKAVFPGLQGGPHMNNIAGIAVALEEALHTSFTTYAEQILKNAKTLEAGLAQRGYTICFGHTENHLLLLDLTNKGLSGKEAQLALDAAGITVNKNVIPDDPRSPMDPSGIRLGTPALTTRGMKEPEMKRVADFIDRAITHREDSDELTAIKQEVLQFASPFPLWDR
ncbi:TPA: serine hydroxymethyltransferase [Candidatus Uhrbacteria bacterium]|nr:serine hydroxymethyltransferase [Candidatus Uhrbacteria bacterium]